MTRFLIAFLALVFSTISYAQTTVQVRDLRVIRVIDGDTVEIDAPFLPVELKQVLSLRVLGVDTPEKGSLAKCDYERAKGEAATLFTKQVVGAATKHQVILVKWDKFGGRVLGDLILDGKSLRDMLIAEGHGRPYYGEKKESWCN